MLIDMLKLCAHLVEGALTFHRSPARTCPILQTVFMDRVSGYFGHEQESTDTFGDAGLVVARLCLSPLPSMEMFPKAHWSRSSAAIECLENNLTKERGEVWRTVFEGGNVSRAAGAPPLRRHSFCRGRSCATGREFLLAGAKLNQSRCLSSKLFLLRDWVSPYRAFAPVFGLDGSFLPPSASSGASASFFRSMHRSCFPHHRGSFYLSFTGTCQAEHMHSQWLLLFHHAACLAVCA